MAYTTDELRVRQSSIITALRFPMAALVVLSHCVLITVNTPATWSFSGDNIFHISELLARSGGPIAVACFSLFSGYFFFLKSPHLTPQGYLMALKKRILTLLVPYLLWNTLTFAILWSKNTIASSIGFAPGISEVEIALLRAHNFLYYLWTPIDYPLWYIKELVLCCIFSPVLYLALRYLKYWVPIALLSLHLVGFNYLGTHVWSHFALGAYFALEGRNMLEFFSRYKLASYALLLPFFGCIIFGSTQPWSFALLPATVSASFNAMSWLLDRRRAIFAWCTRLSPTSFFLYAVHTICIINLVRGALYQTSVVSSSGGKIFVLFATWGLTLLIGLSTYWGVKKVSPKLLEILCGGRA